MILRRFLLPAILASGLAFAACGSEDDGNGGAGGAIGGGGGDDTSAGPLYSIASVVQAPGGQRTLYLHTTKDLETDLDNAKGIEIAGNSRHWAFGGAVFIGHQEEPVIERFEPNAAGKLESVGRINFLAQGITGLPAGIAFISETEAWLFAEKIYEVIVWNPTTMRIEKKIDLSHLQQDGFTAEMYMTQVAGDKVFVPLRYVNYETYTFSPDAQMMIFDHTTDELLGVAKDGRCTGAGTAMVQEDGTAYVLVDGRSYLVQAVAMTKGEDPPHNCILRIPAGATDFDEEFFVDVPALTGGPDAATSFWHAGEGVAFARLFHPDQLPEGAEVSGFDIWNYGAFGLWRFELGDEVKAERVEGVPFGIIDFGGLQVDDAFYIGASTDGAKTTVFAVDPATGEATRSFQMDGMLRDIFRLR